MKDDKEEGKGKVEEDNQGELLFAVKAAQQSLPEGVSPQMGEILAFIEGMAPFLKKETLIQIKCSSCDNYAPSFFPSEDDFSVVEPRAFCHAKKQPHHHLNLFTIAKCLEHSKEAQKNFCSLRIRWWKRISGQPSPTRSSTIETPSPATMWTTE